MKKNFQRKDAKIAKNPQVVWGHDYRNMGCLFASFASLRLTPLDLQ